MRTDKSGLKQLTTRGAHEPQWLPDGKSIVFGTLRTGSASYMEIDPDGEPGSEKPFAALPKGAESPVWSTDGSLVAYAVLSKDGTSRDLGFARTRGGGATGLTSKFWCREWVWSPDGSTLAVVVGKSTGTSIWTVNLETKDVKLRYKGYCSAPAYSPDGKTLALAVPEVKSGFKIVLMDIAKSTEKPLAVSTFDGAKLTWSPDGTRLFFMSSPRSEPAIWSIGVDGTDLVRVTTKATPAGGMAVSSDGKRIAFQVLKPSSFSPELYLCTNTGKAVTALTNSSSPSFWSPAWSPTGKEFAIQSDVGHTVQLLTGSPAGRLGAVCAQIGNRDTAEVRWFADGKTLLLDDGGQLLKVNPSGGKGAATPLSKLQNPVQGTRIVGDDIVATEWVGRDGLLSVLNADGSRKRLVTQKIVEPVKADEATTTPAPHEVAGAASASPSTEGNPHSELGMMGPQVNLAKPESPATMDLWPAVSSNGKMVAFTRSDQLYTVNTDSTGLKQITKMTPVDGGSHTLASPCWSPDDKSILFTAYNNAPGKYALELWICGVEPGSERLVYSEDINTEFGAFYADCTNAPVFMPDGKRILFTSVATGEPRIVSIAVDGSDLRELVRAPSTFPAMDATGARLAYVDLSNAHERICVLDTASGKSKGPLFAK